MFVSWLLLQAHRNDAVGRLAVLASNSNRFPPATVRRLYAFLNWAGDDEKLRLAVKVAHAEWRLSLQTASIIDPLFGGRR